MRDDVELVRSRIDLVELVGQSVALKPAGRNWKGLCPFHDDRNPSFIINPQLGRYKCWSCGASGDVFKWVMETQRLDFVEALKLLAERAGVELTRGASGPTASQREQQDATLRSAQEFFVGQLSGAHEALEYCDRRGLDQGTREAWGLGYAPESGEALVRALRRAGHALDLASELFLVREGQRGWYDLFRGRLMFPIHDERGRLVAFGGRILGSGEPKYINSGDTPTFHKSRVLYGLNAAKDTLAKGRPAILTEGYLDVIACHQAGVAGAVASLGTAITEDHARLLARWTKEVVVLYDRDPAGQKAALRALDVLATVGLRARVARPAEGEDPDSMLRKAGVPALLAVIDRAVHPLQFRMDALRARADTADDAFWDEAATLLANEPHRTQVEKLLSELALHFPGTRDPDRARAAIMDMMRERRRRHAVDRSRPSLPKQSPMSGPEKCVLRALLDPVHTAEAWEACQRGERFVAAAAIRVVGALVAEFSEADRPTPPTAAWLSRLPSEVADELAALESTELPPVTAVELSDALKALDRAVEDRERRRTALELEGEEELRQLTARIRSKQGLSPDGKDSPDR